MLLKIQMASVISTGVDFCTTFVLTKFAGIWYVASSVTGTTVGGVVNFLICRNIVFKSKNQKIIIQALKYLGVWLLNLFVNSTGIYLFTEFLKVDYLISKVIASIAGFFINYYLQKNIVFKSC